MTTFVCIMYPMHSVYAMYSRYARSTMYSRYSMCSLCKYCLGSEGFATCLAFWLGQQAPPTASWNVLFCDLFQRETCSMRCFLWIQTDTVDFFHGVR